jgi:hypothetical protein
MAGQTGIKIDLPASLRRQKERMGQAVRAINIPADRRTLDQNQTRPEKETRRPPPEFSEE